MYIQRDLEEKIRRYLSKPEILAIVGARQCGKTTILKEIYKTQKNAVYIDFEDRDALELFNNDIKSFYKLYAKDADYLFIDEFQYAWAGGQKLKFLYDTYKTKILISGSSVLDLTHQAVSFLVGRIFIFYLYPFNFSEYLRYRNFKLFRNIYSEIKKKSRLYLSGKSKSFPVYNEPILKKLLEYYQEYAVFGGYPRVILSETREEKITVLENIYNTYFLREIRDILQLDSEEELRKLLKALALQAGSLVSYKELGQLTSLNYSNLMKHISILEKTFVIKKIPPYCTNKRIEIAKTPKIFFIDNGFMNTVTKNFQDLKNRADRGSLNENYAAGQLIKEGFDLHYWRTKSKAEVDFVFESEGKLKAIEIKSTLFSNQAGRSLLSFMGKYSPHRTVVASENYSSMDSQRDISFMPIFFL